MTMRTSKKAQNMVQKEHLTEKIRSLAHCSFSKSTLLIVLFPYLLLLYIYIYIYIFLT